MPPGETIPLDTVQIIQVEGDIYVANMVAQDGLRSRQYPVPLRPSYLAILICLEQVAAQVLALKASVHMPRIGCGLTGGKWEEVEPIIQRTLSIPGIPVTVYDLPETGI